MFDYMKYLLLIACIPLLGYSQTTSDTAAIDLRKQRWVAAGMAAGITTGVVILSKYWYQQYPSESFHFLTTIQNGCKWIKPGMYLLPILPPTGAGRYGNLPA